MKIKNLAKNFIKVGVFFNFLALSVIGLNAQTFSSTAELKLACETSPNNIVRLNNPVQITSGPQAPATETVNSKCTISLGQFATFEASQVSMTFNGPLRFEAANEANILLIESQFTAPSIVATQTSKSLFQVERSLLTALTGNIVINSGVEGSVDIKGPLVGGNLVAAGAVNFNGGLKFIGALTDAGVSAGTGINVNMTGDEAQFISTTSTLSAANGAINVTSNGVKGFAEFKLGSITASPRGVNVRLNGNESTINANEFNFDGGTGILFRTGGNKGIITLANGSMNSNAAISIQSSLTGLEGVAILQNARITATSGVRVETGGIGNTEVVDSQLTSGSLIRFITGAGGNCKSQGNTLSAPVLQVCQ